MKLGLGWTAALATSLFIVKGTRIGPVILVVSEKHGMGVHTGDFLSLIPVAVMGAVTARQLLKK